MPRFNQSNIETFIRERQYLTNVSPRTIEWYRNSLRWLPNESPTQAELNDAVIRMREKGNGMVHAVTKAFHERPRRQQFDPLDLPSPGQLLPPRRGACHMDVMYLRFGLAIVCTQNENAPR
jgi:hypothetical protein